MIRQINSWSRYTIITALALLLMAPNWAQAGGGATAAPRGPRMQAGFYRTEMKQTERVLSRQLTRQQANPSMFTKQRISANKKLVKAYELKTEAAKLKQKGDHASAIKLWKKALKLEADAKQSGTSEKKSTKAIKKSSATKATTRKATTRKATTNIPSAPEHSVGIEDRAKLRAGALEKLDSYSRREKRRGRSTSQLRSNWQYSRDLAMRQKTEAESAGNVELMEKHIVNRAIAARKHVILLKAEIKELRAKAEEIGRTNPQRAQKLREKADHREMRMKQLVTAVSNYENKHGIGKGDKAKLRAGALEKLATYDRRMERIASDPQMQRGAAARQRQTAQQTELTGSTSTTDDHGINALAAQAARPKANLRIFRAFLRNKDLDNAEAVFSVMQRDVKDLKGLRAISMRKQISKARRELRKVALRLGKEALVDGSVTRDPSAQDRIQVRDQAKTELRRLKDALAANEIDASTYEQQRNNVIEQTRNVFKTNVSNHVKARRILKKLAQAEKKYRKSPVRRLLSNVASLFVSSAGFATKKLDKALIKEARYRISRGTIDETMAGKMLLDTARTYKLDQTMRRSFNKTRTRAIKNLKRTIAKAVKDGDPQTVEMSYQLKASYAMETNPNFQFSQKEIAQANTHMEKAEMNLLNNLSRLSNWLVNNPRGANYYNYTPDMAANVSYMARQMISQKIANGQTVNPKIVNRLNAVDNKLNARSPGLLKRVAMAPLAPFIGVYKLAKFLTVDQVNHVRYGYHAGGTPPPPIARGDLERILGFQFDGNGGIAQQEASGAPMTYADAVPTTY